MMLSAHMQGELNKEQHTGSDADMPANTKCVFSLNVCEYPKCLCFLAVGL